MNSSDHLKQVLIKERWKVQGSGQWGRGQLYLERLSRGGRAEGSPPGVDYFSWDQPCFENKHHLSSVVYPFFVSLIYKCYEWMSE